MTSLIPNISVKWLNENQFKITKTHVQNNRFLALVVPNKICNLTLFLTRYREALISTYNLVLGKSVYVKGKYIFQCKIFLNIKRLRLFNL